MARRPLDTSKYIPGAYAMPPQDLPPHSLYQSSPAPSRRYSQQPTYVPIEPDMYPPPPRNYYPRPPYHQYSASDRPPPRQQMADQPPRPHSFYGNSRRSRSTHRRGSYDSDSEDDDYYHDRHKRSSSRRTASSRRTTRDRSTPRPRSSTQRRDSSPRRPTFGDTVMALVNEVRGVLGGDSRGKHR